MSDKTITQLSELTTVENTDILPIVDDPTGTPITKKATAKNVVKGGASSGAVSALIDANLTASKALVSDASGKVISSSVSSTELGHLSGVTSSVQNQINSKQASITGGASTIVENNLAQDKALISNSSGKVSASSVSATELSYIANARSSIQDQIDQKPNWRGVQASHPEPWGIDMYFNTTDSKVYIYANSSWTALN